VLRKNTEKPVIPPGHINLSVLYCGICRTDAKMWAQGHRDLVLPRVLGHEIAAVDTKTGNLYTVWPGQACGSCSYCRTEQENLCEEMKIIGFHSDGGFASSLVCPVSSLIQVEEDIAPQLLCFCEPVACVLNGLKKVGLEKGETVIIYGGGVIGLLAALVCLDKGAYPTLVEKDEYKIAKAAPFADTCGISITQDCEADNFDIALNGCDSPLAFGGCLRKLRKGGRFCYFSGLPKDSVIDAENLNLIHYKELLVSGSYGPRTGHMRQAVSFCARQQPIVSLLIEEIISPEVAPVKMTDILAGKAYKYLIDFTDQAPHF
jgi:nicotinate-nucleotide--dimethylbenzimidazole phosphoribosyltransferase